MHHACAPKFNERDFYPRLVALIHGACGVERHQSRGLDLRRRLGDVGLDLSFFREQGTMRKTGLGAFTHQFKSALRLSEPPHAVKDATRAEAFLRNNESFSPL